MDQSALIGQLVAFTLDASFLAGVPLAAATGCGLIISILQAITQIQDQSLAQTAKIVTIGFVLLSFGGWLVTPLVISSAVLFDTFATIGQ
jgi:type III secretory pathway component EscS